MLSDCDREQAKAWLDKNRERVSRQVNAMMPATPQESFAIKPAHVIQLCTMIATGFTEADVMEMLEFFRDEGVIYFDGKLVSAMHPNRS